MGHYHLKRSWAIILQQAWSMYLKDRVGTTPSPHKISNMGLIQEITEVEETMEPGEGSALILTVVVVCTDRDVNLTTVVLSVINSDMVHMCIIKQRKMVEETIITMVVSTILVNTGISMRRNSKKAIKQANHKRFDNKASLNV